jgi:hypothetical protein
MHQRDSGSGLELARIGVSPRVVDAGLWIPQYSLHKFYEHRDRVGKAGRQGLSMAYLMENFELMEPPLKFHDNCLLQEGINELWALIAGTGATKFDAGNAYMGVGDDGTAADPTDTGLKGAENAGTHKLYVAMDGSYPTYGTSQKATWRSTYTSPQANFHWQEITVANGNSDAAKNLNRKVQDMGTKASGSTWAAALEVTLA